MARCLWLSWRAWTCSSDLGCVWKVTETPKSWLLSPYNHHIKTMTVLHLNCQNPLFFPSTNIIKQKDSHHMSRVRSNHIYISWHICLQHIINTRMHLPAAANTTGPSSSSFLKSKQVDPMVLQHIMSWKDCMPGS